MIKRMLVSLLLGMNVFILQAQIQGVVIDKDNKKPLSDVIVQYGATSKDFVYTSGDGRFSIPEFSDDVIYFQSIGYKSKAIPKTTLSQLSAVIMELNPVSLNPIIISPGDADRLLEEVMINTKKKLLTGEPLGYLLHFLQTKSTDTLQNEIYLKYTTTLNEKILNKNLKKERVPYLFNIVDIRRVQRTETPTSELYGAEYHASHLFTFGKSINNETTRSYSSDSSYIILQIAPLEGREGWATGEIKINKDDMTIASMEIESVDSVLAVQPFKRYMGKKLRILRKVGRFEFAKKNEKYYLKECYTYYKFRGINEYGREEDITYFCDVEYAGSVDKLKIRRRRLSGYCQELFYFPDSTKEIFW
ncbi:MAG: hypothetical protein E6767_03355 [Dysgonomonas sp.]|nr:hypothetical protein [Dysgonomonas sp.]